MNALWTFLRRTQGRRRLNWVDWLSYGYLALGVLVILLPVLWIGLNSFKSQTQLEKNDLSLLPNDFVRVARGTINDRDGKRFIILQNLPDWVLNWHSLSDEERGEHDALGFVESRRDRDAVGAMRHLVDRQAHATA